MRDGQSVLKLGPRWPRFHFQDFRQDAEVVHTLRDVLYRLLYASNTLYSDYIYSSSTDRDRVRTPRPLPRCWSGNNPRD